jgi:hypothetical protein
MNSTKQTGYPQQQAFDFIKLKSMIISGSSARPPKFGHIETRTLKKSVISMEKQNLFK